MSRLTLNVYGVIDHELACGSGTMAPCNPVHSVMVLECFNDGNEEYFCQRHHKLENEDNPLKFFTLYNFPSEQMFGKQIDDKIHFKVELINRYYEGEKELMFIIDRSSILSEFDLRKVEPIKSFYTEVCTGCGAEEGGWSTYGNALTDEINGDFDTKELWSGQYETTASNYYC